MKQPFANGTLGRPPRAQRWLTAAALIVGAVLVFWLPWRVPVRGGIESDSSFFGFSNGAALAGLALTLFALLAIRLATPGGAALLAGLVGPGRPATTAERGALVVGILVTTLVIGGWWSLLPSAFFGESTYFLTRLDMLQYGLHPYRDFDFGYGPALLLVPAALHWGSGRLLAMDTAYVVTVIAHSALGLMAASAILRRLSPDARLRRTILAALILLAALNITLGVIYSLLRFIYAPWAALVFHEAQRRNRPWVGWTAAFLLPFDALQISPEVGIATTAALIVGLAFEAARGRADLLPRGAAVLAAPAAFLTVHGVESLEMLRAFGSGVLNFPILPAPFMIALLGLACFLLPALGAAALRGGDGSAPATASLAVALGMMLPAALGRCDPGHVLMNGLMLMGVATVAAFTRCGRATRRLVATAAAVMFVTGLFSHVITCGRPVRTALETRRLIDREAAALAAGDAAVLRATRPIGSPPDFGWSKRPPFDPSLLDLTKYESIAAPLGASEDVDRFLKLSGRYVPVRSGCGDRASAERLAADAMRSEHVFLPEPHPSMAMEIGERALRKSLYIGALFVLPVVFPLPPVNEPFTIEEAVQRIIRAAYEPVEDFPPGQIFRRRPGPADAAPGR
jgi:hypothetical protein